MVRPNSDLKLTLDLTQASALSDLIDRETKMYSKEPRVCPARINELRLLGTYLRRYVCTHT